MSVTPKMIQRRLLDLASTARGRQQSRRYDTQQRNIGAERAYRNAAKLISLLVKS